MVCLSYLVLPSDFHSSRITREKILDFGWSVCPTSFLQVISIRPESLGKKILDFGWSVCPTSFFQVISIRPESLGKKSWICVGLSVLPRSSGDFHSARITREKILDLGWSVCPTSFFQVISIRPESLGKKSWISVGLSVLPRSS